MGCKHLIYSKRDGGFYDFSTPNEHRPKVAVDTDMVGWKAEPWMYKVAELESGVGSANEVITEVLHHYKFKNNGAEEENKR